MCVVCGIVYSAHNISKYLRGVGLWPRTWLLYQSRIEVSAPTLIVLDVKTGRRNTHIHVAGVQQWLIRLDWSDGSSVLHTRIPLWVSSLDFLIFSFLHWTFDLPSLFGFNFFDFNFDFSTSRFSLSFDVCVLFTLNDSSYPSTSRTKSCLCRFFNPREIHIRWSKKLRHRDTTVMYVATYKYVPVITAVDNIMPCHHTRYDRYDIPSTFLWNRETKEKNKYKKQSKKNKTQK